MADVQIDQDAANIPAINVINGVSDASAPGSGHAKLYVKDGVLYVRLDTGDPVAVGGLVALAEGQLAIGDGSGDLSALALGTEGYVVTADANGFATWAESVAGGGLTPDPNGDYQMRTVLYDNTLASDGTGWDVQNIPGTYDDLEICLMARGTAGAEYQMMTLAFNNDSTAANYRYTRHYAAYMDHSYTTDDGANVIPVSGANAPSGSVGTYIGHILHYSGTTFRKQIRLTGQWRLNSAAEYLDSNAIEWESTSAISRIAFTMTNFLAGSRLRIIGIGTI